MKHLNKKINNVHTPVQIIQARQDDMTSVKNAFFIYNRISSLKKEIVLLENSYHVVTADQEREKVAQSLERFFDSIGEKKIEEPLVNACAI